MLFVDRYSNRPGRQPGTVVPTQIPENYDPSFAAFSVTQSRRGRVADGESFFQDRSHNADKTVSYLRQVSVRPLLRIGQRYWVSRRSSRFVGLYPVRARYLLFDTQHHNYCASLLLQGAFYDSDKVVSKRRQTRTRSFLPTSRGHQGAANAKVPRCLGASTRFSERACAHATLVF